MNRFRIIIIATLTCVASIVYATDYNVLSEKAARFFKHKEWASASAMYTLMLEQQSGQCQTYGNAIVAAGMRSDTLSQLALMRQSIDNHIPFDSIFNSVKEISFNAGSASVYEQFLLLVQRSESWMSRSIDRYLLDYYTFRNDASNMITYSKRMLKGLPNDTRFLTTLAKGYMLNGQYGEGLITYEKILDEDPDNYNALLQLGNYYDITAQDNAQKIKALEYLTKAKRLRSSPYVEDAIKRIEKETGE